MTIYCDESGGLSAGAMTFAAVSLMPEAAAAVHHRFRAITGLSGELKGSRISPVERGLLIELFASHGGKAWVAVAVPPQLAPTNPPLTDLGLYSALLDLAVGQWLPETGGSCADVVIDEGRYDAQILGVVRGEIQRALGQWGHASLADSRRSDGIQIADVIANSIYHIAARTPRRLRVEAIVAPLIADGRLRLIHYPDAA